MAQKNTARAVEQVRVKHRAPELPALAYYAGLTVLGVVGLLEWPLVAAVGVGHILANNHHSRVMAELGEALEEA
jgi:hypothetical protein